MQIREKVSIWSHEVIAYNEVIVNKSITLRVVDKMQKRKDKWPTLRSVQFLNEREKVITNDIFFAVCHLGADETFTIYECFQFTKNSKLFFQMKKDRQSHLCW